EDTLARHPAVARAIVEMFEAQFDPDAQDKAAARVKTLQARILTALEAVTSLDEDRILRRFVNLVDCALRTNYFQRGADGAPRPWLAIKFDSRRIDDLPLPRPLYEIFVHSTRFDAIHLRGGK